VLHAGSRGGLRKHPMLRDAGLAPGGEHHEHSRDSLEFFAYRVRSIERRAHRVGARQAWCTGQIADQEPLPYPIAARRCATRLPR
jgi:hypothetical protein